MRTRSGYVFLLLMSLPVIFYLAACGWAVALEALDITRNADLTHLPEIEASGLLYLEDTDRFLLISDETDNHLPMVYTMNRQGHVENTLVIENLQRIDDLEAICKGDDGDIYLCCSQSLNKKEQIPDDRKLFLRIEKHGTTLKVKNQVLLYDLLRDAIERSGGEGLKKLIPFHNGRMDIDIEGIFYRGGTLFLGFKEPKDAGRAVILQIPDINLVLQHNRIPEKGISVWRTLPLMDPVLKVPTGISDLCLYQDRLFILSYSKIEKNSPLTKTGLKKVGCLWEYNTQQDRLSWIETFQNLQPEGIAVFPDPASRDSISLQIVCDGDGKTASKYFMRPLN